MRTRLVGLLVCAMLATGWAGGAPATASASSPCGTANYASRDVFFRYHDLQDADYSTTVLHVRGCWTGKTSWGLSVRMTWDHVWWLLGSASRYVDPAYFTNSSSGNTFFTGRPVFHYSAGLEGLETPNVMLSGAGVWYAYDYTSQVCSDGSITVWSLLQTTFPDLDRDGDTIEMGPLDYSAAGTVTPSCTSRDQAPFYSLWFGTYD